MAMPMYALATIPLIKKLDKIVHQVWYADDATGVGKVADLRKWWDEICSKGPAYGYFTNASKTWLITKETHHTNAVAAFTGTNVKVTSEGRPHLGAAIGTNEFKKRHIMGKVQVWSDEINSLASIAHTQPHAVYAAFTHGFTSKWSYLSRTIPDIGPLLQPLEDLIRMKLLPTLTGRPPPNDFERELFGLPARLGGLALSNPAQCAATEFSASVKITGPLINAILEQNSSYSYDVIAGQMTAKTEIASIKRNKWNEAAENLKKMLSNSLQRAMDLAQEKGASSWLTSLPIEEFGFTLHKRAFFDALALRYNWQPSRMPTSCACGSNFTIEHSMSCPKGRFPSIRHNEIRDLTAKLLTEVCHDVSVEPDLQTLTGEQLTKATANTQDGARLDIAANGFWGGRHERCFLDVRVFNPHAPSNRQSQLSATYKKHERIKKRAYEQRVREVEHASFTPLVFAATGGMANEATHFYKRLASHLATKWDQLYSSTMSWLRCRRTFSLLCSAIQCIRGARSSCGQACRQAPSPSSIDLINSESGLVSE